ncbi:precorrin-4 C(11)-methyltransferase [Prochlorococcus sp. MIT 1341]|uniref:precorrin-4 C(11)-methyltransferase n=1 Tax=Prochlorococcus sp. MIT 1341 TaxID=3096221 RepID=UPI002A74F76F|nr:precorrin-4 C(11)-methyltransferase [Prochlorococcus sp. MIT 1341]
MITTPIAFVGAGPGAPDLLTIRAAEHLKKADVLIWTDSLVNPQITDLAKKSCEKIRTSSLTLENILNLLIKKAQEGKKVVRLHDGDPCLYGAISEQISGLIHAKIDFEVIPGISAYQATAANLKRELTIPGIVQTIILSRASGRTGVPKKECLERLASHRASLCLYLSARHVEEAQSVLLEHYPEETPVAISYRVSWPDQWIALVPLREMAKTSIQKKLIRTTLYLISPALEETTMRSKLYSPEHDHLFRQKQ